MDRRDLIGSALVVLAWPTTIGGLGRIGARHDAKKQLADIERRVGGRLGVTAIDIGSDTRLDYRADERFPMCSTFKWLLAAHVLARVDDGEEKLERLIPYKPSDLLEWAPVTRDHISEGALSVEALCDAAVRYSDNTAANLLLDSVGGPSGLTAFLRSIGDPVTRLDRSEPELNSSIPDDPRDTTTPSAMAENLRRIPLGDVLEDGSRKLLQDWLVGNTTGGSRLRAGLPDGWRAGDKTGTGPNGTTNDVAIAWPEEDVPAILITAYLTESDAAPDDQNTALADVGRVAADWHLAE